MQKRKPLNTKSPSPAAFSFTQHHGKEDETLLELTTLSGESHFLANQIGLSRKQAVNGNRSLSFLLPRTDVNAHAFNLVEEECFITDQSTKHRYRIKQVEQRVTAQTPVKSIFATHEFFDLIDVYRYDTLTTGVKTIAQILDFIFNGTGWTYSVINAFNNLEFENFGDDNCIALFNKAIQRFGFEFELRDDKHVTIRNQIGNDADLQFRYNHNVKTFKHTVDTSNLSTYIRGEGKVVNDVPVVTAEYTSPNAAIFGIRHAKPYTNETIIHQPTLIEALKRQIIDAPEVSIELEFSVLKDAGYLSEKPGLGDRVPTIYEPLGIDLDLRVMEIEDYPGTNQAPKVTLSTIRKTYGSALTDYTKSLFDAIFDSDAGKVRFDVLDEAVKRATEALNNSLTELEYPPGMGIVARDPDDPLRFVAFRSSGLGVTTDGGVTFPNAITADGVVAERIVGGAIYGVNLSSINGSGTFRVSGSDAEFISGSGRMQMNPDGIYSFNNNGSSRFQADGFLVTSRALGTTTANVYLAAQGGKEARVVDMKDVPSDGEIGSYSYLPVRGQGFYGNYVEVNAGENGNNLYLRPRSGGEVRITGASTTDSYYPLRASTLYAGSFVSTTNSAWIGTDNLLHVVAKGTAEGSLNPIYRDIRAARMYGTGFVTTSTHAYAGTDDELRVQNKSLSGVWRNVRANVYFGNVLESNDGTNVYLRPSSGGEVRVTAAGTTDTYGDFRCNKLYRAEEITTSTRRLKKNITDYEQEALPQILSTPIREFHLKTDLDEEKKRLGVIMEESPADIVDIKGEGVQDYAMAAMAWKAIQELAAYVGYKKEV